MHILNAFQLSCIEFHPTGDTRQAPEILVFEVGSVAPAHHLQFQRILALTNVFGEIETGFQLAVFAVADGLPVHTNLHVGRYAADAQADLLAHPVLIELEGAAIHASVIVFLGYERRIVLKMALPGVSHVDINRLTIALKFPHAGDADRSPVAVLVAEVPLPVQRHRIPRSGNKRGCHRQTVDFEHAGVLPRLHFLRGGRQGRQGGKYHQRNYQISHNEIVSMVMVPSIVEARICRCP